MRGPAGAIAAAVAVSTAGGCATTIVPPETVAEPATVYVLDYGRHTSLLLPAEHSFAEYAYGEWNWFALDRSRLVDAFGTLLLPTKACLGRMQWTMPDDPDVIRYTVRCVEVLPLAVEAEAVADLREELDAIYLAAEEPHYQPLYNLYFVPHDEAYHVLHNCNQELAEWLRSLGCRTRGFAIVADFEVREPGS
jgi:hypothetical protein